MNILILTDHQTHSSTNSFYLLANSLNQHREVDSVDVASRSFPQNTAFFEGRKVRLSVKQIDGDLSYEEFHKWNEQGLRDIKTLENYDYILLRLPRPIHDQFFPFLTENFNENHIINRPSGIIKTGNKSFLINVKEYCAPIALVQSINEIEKIASKFAIVLKPLEEYGGKGILKIEGDQVSFGNAETSTFEEFRTIYNENPIPYLAMKFLKNVHNGDKRIVVANGKILTATLRYPGENSWLCNIAQGGNAELSTPTKREKEIVAFLDPILKSEGIFMYGLDTLENDDGKRVISEINTLSVGGIAPSADLSGLKLGEMYADLFVNFVSSLN